MRVSTICRRWSTVHKVCHTMIDVHTGEYSSASELNKARASAHRVAYLKSIIEIYMKLQQKIIFVI